jgi:ribonuclease HII
MLVCGVDEAGRGPVIGPMVMAGVAIAEEKLPELKALGVKDSKLLSPKRRQELYKQIIELVDNYSIIEISPNEIDQRNADGTNLNQLEALKIAEILTALKPDKVYVDSPEPANGGKKFGDMILSHMNCKTPEIIAEHGADMKYPTSSAASILAKVTRDNAVKCISKEIGHCIGSGYPADPKCKEFLKTHYSDDKHINHIRTCWSTYQKLKKKKSQANLDNW